MKLLLKGVETGEDAKIAREHGVDGIIVSNHGGRATEDLRPTIETLPEVIEAVGNQIPVLVDGGMRRGSDAFKALAMGARAVGIGRPYVWGLAAFGQDGRRARARHPARGTAAHHAPMRNTDRGPDHAVVGRGRAAVVHRAATR